MDRCQQRRGAPPAPQAVGIQTEHVFEAKVPEVNAAAIRQSVKDLARERADAGKVLATISATTESSSLGYERARLLEAEHGLLRNSVQVNNPAPYDYYRDTKGTAHLDFSQTQNASVRTEPVIYESTGPHGRVHRHVTNQRVQTLSSEKVRIECDISSTFAIHVGQHDTVFLNAAKQRGDKQIALSHQHEGALAVVLGKDQTLRDLTFDASKGIATVTTDQGTITVSGIANAKALQIGRDKGNGAPPAFVSIDGVAATVRSGRQENFQKDAALVKGALNLGGNILGFAQKVMAQTTPPAPSGGIQPPVEKLSDDRIVTPLPPPGSFTVPPVEMRPEVPPMPGPPPTPSPSDGKSEELVRLEAQLERNADHTREIQERLARAEEAQRKTAELHAKEEERVKLAELKLEVNDILDARGERNAKGGEFAEARNRLLNDPSRIANPVAEEIVTALMNDRTAKRIEVERSVRSSIGGISEKTGLAETKEWADKNMALYGTLDEHGKKTFVDVIKGKMDYGVGLEKVDPKEFFDARLAYVASEEIRKATRVETRYLPPSSRPGPFIPQTHTVPDIGQISHIIRSVEDRPEVLSLLAETQAYKEARAELPTKGLLYKESGLEQRSLDARVKGNKERAEALLIRSFVDGGRADTTEARKTIAEAWGQDPVVRRRIADRYRDIFGSDIYGDLK